MPPRRGTTTARRRKPRDLSRSLILDQLEKIEEASRRRALSDVETEFLLKAHKAAIEEAAVDAEADFLDGLSDPQLDKIHEQIILTIEENREALPTPEESDG